MRNPRLGKSRTQGRHVRCLETLFKSTKTLRQASTESTPDQSRACDFYHTRSGSGKFLKKHLAWLRTSIFDALLGGRLVRLQESACPNVYGLPTGALARFLVELMLTRYGLRISTVQSV